MEKELMIRTISATAPIPELEERLKNMDISSTVKTRKKPHGKGNGNGNHSDIEDAGQIPLVGTSPLVGRSSMASENYDIYEIRRDMFLRVAGAALLIVSLILLTVVIYLATKPAEIQYCDFNDKDHVTPRDFEKPDVFDDLTPAELNRINEYMLKEASLDLTKFAVADVNSSYILSVELQIPPKAEALQYLDNGSKKPKREAKVVVVRGNTIPPRVDEYIISNIDQPKRIKWAVYKNPSYRRHPIPYTSRPIDDVDYRSIFVVIRKASEELYPLLMESYGLCYHNCTKGVNCMVWYDVAPRGRVSGERKSWTWGFPHIDGWYIHPLGLELLIEHSSPDVRTWGVEKVVYNGQMFSSIADLMKAFYDKTLTILHINKEDKRYSSYEARGDLPKSPVQGPKLTEPEGKRFQVHGRHVDYKDWSFFIRMRQSTGMQLFDVKFRSQRIAYEISLQEVLVLYTGYGPAQSNTNFYDASWYLGASNMELAKGIDCPDTAVFLDSHFFINSAKPKHTKNNICIFENNPNIPLRRHFAYDVDSDPYFYKFYGGIPDYSLVVRTVANVWNYDYIFDYIFHLNGAVEIQAAATGFVQSTLQLPQEAPYGSIIHDHVMADLHQHIFNYKIDFDLAGTKNRFSTLDIGLETIDDPWRQGMKRTKSKITPSLKTNEQDMLNIDPHKPAYYIIHNKEAQNHYHASRGYRIYNKSPLTLLADGVPEIAAAYWANYSVLVTKRKESEDMSTSIYAQNEPWDPVLDFKDFIADNESIVDRDIVAWVTMGTHHIPGTEDVPSTPTVWNKFSTFLAPHNFFVECPSINSADNVVIHPTKDGNDVNSFGTSFESKCIPKFTGPKEFSGTSDEL